MAAPPNRRGGAREELRPAATKPPATRRGPSGRAPPAPRPPPLLTAVTRRPEDHARLRRLRTLMEPPEEPRGAPPAVGVRLSWRPEPAEDAGKAGLEAEPGSEVGVELLCGGRPGRPLHGDRELRPLHGHTELRPLHGDTELQLLHGDTKLQPLHRDTELQLLHGDTKLQPLHRDTELQLLHGDTELQPLHRDTELQLLHGHSVTQPLQGVTKAQPLHTPAVTQPLHTPAVTQPLHTHAVTQPLHTPAVTQPLHTPAAVQPMEFPPRPPPAPPAALWDLLAQLSSALPARSSPLPAEPLLEPAATDLNLTAGKSRQRPRGAPKAPRAQKHPQQPPALPQDYQQFLTAAGSDFLHAIFDLSGADSGEELPDEHPWGTAEPRPAARGTAEPRPAAPTPKPQELQHRLHRLWAALQLPTGERLAMATKYGPAAARRRLKAALELWEEAAALIRRRERLLALLEGMELQSSDPNRFFQRQRRPGLPSSAALHGETRARRRLNAEVLRCEEELQGMLRRLREEFGDVVTLRGRSYEEKLRRDRGEMLYRLQQGRRAAAMGGVVQSALGRR